MHGWTHEVDPLIQVARFVCDVLQKFEDGTPAQAPLPRGGALHGKLKSGLHQLLVEKGVPGDKVANRISLPTAQVGSDDIEAALKLPTSRQQWAQLCTAAGDKVRLLSTDEAKAAKRNRASNNPKQPADPLQVNDPWSKSKPAKREPISADKLTGAPHGSYSTRLCRMQLGLIALVALKQAQPFLTSQKALSTLPLGLFVLEDPTSIVTLFPLAKCDCPAKQNEDGSHIIILGTLIQLGDAEVIRHRPPGACQTMPPESAALRVTLHKQLFSAAEWKELLAHPIKSTIQKLDSLRGDPAALIDYWGVSSCQVFP